MGTPAATFTNGTTMSPTATAAADTAARDYLNNGLVGGDFADDGLTFPCVFRPDYGLVPSIWEEAVSQSIGGGSMGFDTPTFPTQDQGQGRGVGQSQERYNLYPNLQVRGGYLPIPGLSRRMPVDATALVEVTAQFFAQAVSSTATDDHAGHFELRYRRVEADLNGDGTTFGGTRRICWSREERGYFVMFGQVSLSTSGNYDFFVVYKKGSAAAGVTEVVVAQRTIVVEVFQQP